MSAVVSKTLTDVSLEVLKKRLAGLTTSNFNFAFFGDTWFAWGDARKQKFANAKNDAIRRYQIFQSCLNAAAKLKPKPLFILYGGDGVRSGTAEQITFFKNTVVKFVRKHKIPFFMVPGNHERTGVHGSLNIYQNRIGPKQGDKSVKENDLNFIVNIPNLRLIMLNDIGPVQGGAKIKYGITSSALSTFNEGVKTKRAVTVVMHVPPKSGAFADESSSEAFPINTPNNIKFIANLKQASNVKLLLVSHIHNRLEKGKVAGKVAVLNGNGGAGTDTVPTPKPAIATFTFHNKNKSITFNGQKSVNVNTGLRPDKIFIQVTDSKVITVPLTASR